MSKQEGEPIQRTNSVPLSGIEQSVLENNPAQKFWKKRIVESEDSPESLNEFIESVKAIKVTPEDIEKGRELLERFIFDIRAGINRDPDQRLN